jgi:hypothetical protein
VGGCKGGSPYDGGGCVYMVSSAAGSDSALLETDESGENVFFTSNTALTPSAPPDEKQDLYDARVDGGVQEATVIECVTPEKCKGSPPLPPPEQSLGSSVFSGPGDVLIEPSPVEQPHVLTRAEMLAKALTACRHQHRGKDARVRCEKSVRARYRAEMLADALKACRHEHGPGHARVECEKRARARYRAHSASVRKARAGEARGGGAG